MALSMIIKFTLMAVICIGSIDASCESMWSTCKYHLSKGKDHYKSACKEYGHMPQYCPELCRGDCDHLAVEECVDKDSRCPSFQNACGIDNYVIANCRITCDTCPTVETITHKPPATTHKLPIITEEPMTTTEMPMTTTEMPMTTTEMPITTTEMPITTTEMPMTTTEMPMTTTEMPMTTTEMPMTTTEMPMTTTEMPITTTEMPMTTTEMPMTTTEMPITTTEMPITTTEMPTTTTERPKTTIQKPTTTAQTSTKKAPTTTKKPYSNVTHAPVDGACADKESMCFVKFIVNEANCKSYGDVCIRSCGRCSDLSSNVCANLKDRALDCATRDCQAADRYDRHRAHIKCAKTCCEKGQLMN